MPLNVKCKNCNNYRNNWCERVIDSPDPDMVRDCRHFWEKTNADRIRAMSDEELADFMTRRNVAESCLRLADEGYTPTEEQKQVLYDSLYPVWMEWLHAPAEGE